MVRDLVKLPKIESSFLSCERDTEEILKRLFVTSQPYSNTLKRLLVINTDDCLDNKPEYEEIIKNMNLQQLKEKGYVCIEPKIRFKEHEEVKAYLLLSFDNFSPTKTNPQFRDCVVNFDIICNTDYWDIGNYRLRPLKIAGIIDGILNNSKLTGIGTLQFLGCNALILDENLSGYTLSYAAVHGHDDNIPPEE